MTAENLRIVLALALLLLLAGATLPPSSRIWRLLTSGWHARHRSGFGQPGRMDYVRHSFKIQALALGVALVGVAAGIALSSDALRDRADQVLGGLMFGAMILAIVLGLAGLLTLLEAVRWKPWRPLRYEVRAGTDLIGETDLEQEALAHGTVSGGMRPAVGFAQIADAVATLSDQLRSAPDVSARKALMRTFSARHSLAVTRDGLDIAAHVVAIVDLERVELGRGYWAEVTLRDVNDWARDRGASEGSEA